MDIKKSAMSELQQLTQDIFGGAPDCFISAAVDSDGTAYLYTAPSKELTAVTDIEDDEGVWAVSKPNYGWIVVGEYDATDWQNSAINREAA